MEGILPATGTSADGRVLAHLHRVQEVADTGPIVNVIEVMGCCEDAAADLVGELNELLPKARVVTISQLVQTQVTVNRLMNRLSYVIFGILMLAFAGVFRHRQPSTAQHQLSRRVWSRPNDPAPPRGLRG